MSRNQGELQPGTGARTVSISDRALMSERERMIANTEPPERLQARCAEPGPPWIVAAILRRRVGQEGATLADIEEAVDRGRYALSTMDRIAGFLLGNGSAAALIARQAVIDVMADRLEEKTEAQIDAEYFRYWR